MKRPRAKPRTKLGYDEAPQHPSPMPIPEITPTVTVEEAAAILGISRGLAYQGVRDGTLPSITIGRRIIVPTLALAALLATPSPTPQRPGAS